MQRAQRVGAAERANPTPIPPIAPHLHHRSNWKSGTCSGHSVSVLLKELDRRGLVVAREETSGGKRICYFRNIAC